jgi:hypothetical protein
MNFDLSKLDKLSTANQNASQKGPKFNPKFLGRAVSAGSASMLAMKQGLALRFFLHPDLQKPRPPMEAAKAPVDVAKDQSTAPSQAPGEPFGTTQGHPSLLQFLLFM